LPQQERVNIAVFIDFDNIEIGVRTTLGEHFDIGTVLEALKERGEVVTKIAYADWTRAGEYSRALTQHAIRLVQRNLTPGGDKNGADINLALDALEMAFTHPHINAYVIVGGDSDFLSLVEKLKQYDKKVFVVGGRAFTSVILQRNCHEFIAYENLVRKPAVRGGRPDTRAAAAPIAQAFPIVRRAIKILADREVTPQTGLLKSTLLQLDSTFSERNYGASSFLDFTEKLAQAGLVQLKQAGRSVIVELTEGFTEDSDAGPRARAAGNGDVRAAGESQARAAGEGQIRVAGEGQIRAAGEGQAGGAGEGQAGGAGEGQAHGAGEGQTHGTWEGHIRAAGQGEAGEAATPAGDQVLGVKLAGQILAAATTARWPMYLRNVKQILRAGGGYDERRYGFGGLMDLLRACQREGFVRLERDRRGGLRVFQGQALARGAAPAETQGSVPADMVVAVEPAEVVTTSDPLDSEAIEVDAVTVIDTTAELLGRAKPRRPRVRASAPRKAAPKKPGGATHRTGRPRKAATNDGNTR
jgi:uncharacterized LabA/DUF88 family protein